MLYVYSSIVLIRIIFVILIIFIRKYSVLYLLTRQIATNLNSWKTTCALRRNFYLHLAQLYFYVISNDKVIAAEAAKTSIKTSLFTPSIAVVILHHFLSFNILSKRTKLLGEYETRLQKNRPCSSRVTYVQSVDLKYYILQFIP